MRGRFLTGMPLDSGRRLERSVAENTSSSHYKPLNKAMHRIMNGQ